MKGKNSLTFDICNRINKELMLHLKCFLNKVNTMSNRNILKTETVYCRHYQLGVLT